MIQYSDRNIGPRDFPASQLLLTRVFHTLQGEGPSAGQPAVFVRLAGCNRGDKTTMGCDWCDTSFEFDNGVKAFDHEVVAMVRGFAKDGLVVITGGEPMIQDNVVPLIEQLTREHYDVHIESNGDRLAPGFIEKCPNATLGVSPKIHPKSQTYHPLRPDVYERLDFLKFIVSADAASPYHDVPDYAQRKYRRVYLSPMAVYKMAVPPNRVANVWDDDLIDRAATRANYRYAAELARKRRFALSVQMQLFAEIP
jgi:organic radical activating enzyme